MVTKQVSNSGQDCLCEWQSIFVATFCFWANLVGRMWKMLWLDSLLTLLVIIVGSGRAAKIVHGPE